MDFLKEYELLIGAVVILVSAVGITRMFFDKDTRRARAGILILVIVLDVLSCIVYVYDYAKWGMLMWEFAAWALISLLVMNATAFVFFRSTHIGRGRVYALCGLFLLAFLVFGLYFIFPEVIRSVVA